MKTIDKKILETKTEIKELIIVFIKTLRGKELYQQNSFFKRYVEELAEGTPKEVDDPWYNNGKLVIEPSVSFQDMRKKENILEHYLIYKKEIEHTIQRIYKKIDRYEEWLKSCIFNLENPFVIIESSPLSHGLSDKIYGYIVHKHNDFIVAKTYPKEVKCLQPFTKEEFHVQPMNEEDFEVFLNYDLNAVKSHKDIIDLEDYKKKVIEIFKNYKHGV